ncbi:hypothetical protein ACIBL3_37300 [Kribbella sp. NPDC050124]|uniref:family 4 glycosyl hydrolase n=1 Tax=Kribbella sp. NPDC050124 TaxID=3364114 RepID=UPI003791EF73
MKITIIGGGSRTWTPRLIQDFLRTPELSGAEYVLLDIDRPAADLMATFATQLAAKFDVPATITATQDQASALDGADYVVITITTGGLDTMANDLDIAERHGIYHTVGDTCGPGGWSRLIRNADVFIELAKAINKYAPGAAVINYTNPLAQLTKLLSEHCIGPVVGLCHGVVDNRDFLTKRYGPDIEMAYGGINHFYWTTRATVGDRDVLADLAAVVEHTDLDTLEADREPDPLGFSSGHAVATELFRLAGALPYLADRHNCEFVPWYITDLERMEQYGLRRTSVAARLTKLTQQQESVEHMIRDGIPDDWVKPSGETVADIVRAHYTGEPFIDVGNVPNRGQIANLPEGVVVETPVRYDKEGFTPVHIGALPAAAASLVEPWAHVYELEVQACVDRDPRRALDALRLAPTCATLSSSRVRDMGQALLTANRPYVEWL